MSDIRKKKKITSEYRKLWYYEMLYGTLKYHEPPIRLAKYEIDSHIFMHQVQGNNYTYEMAIKDFGKRKVDLLLSNGLIEKENGLMIDKRVIENVEEVLDKSVKRTEAANIRCNKEKENKEINDDANA